MTINFDSLRPGEATPAPDTQAPRPQGSPASRTSFESALALARSARAASYAPASQPQVEAGDEPSPPPEVQAQTAAAARTWETLQASGREVHFSQTPGGRVGVSMHHVSGEQIAVLQLNDLYTLIEQETTG
jgi:hypothetical protein